PPLRAALHAGPAQPHNGAYLGATLRRARRLLEAAHPGQTLVSQAAFNGAQGHALGEAGLLDLGSHRLADLLRAEHIYQLVAPGLPRSFPPIMTLDSFAHNLPTLPTPLIGRLEEIDELSELLLDPQVRLVTILGPSGTGKTRLSLQAGAALLRSFRDGVFVASLAPVGDPELVPAAIAMALGVQEEAEQGLFETLVQHLSQRELLLILDNVEQLLGATPLIQHLLSRTAGLKIVATSQALLKIPEEVGYLLPPLAVPGLASAPPPEQLGAFPAVALYIECAQAVSPGWQLEAAAAPAVIELCARLAGLPLAIELVAAHSDCWQPQDLLVTLRGRLAVDAEARKGSSREHILRDVLDWCYAQLGAEERALFARLSVFAGGCTLEEAAAVCAEPGARQIVESVDGLLNRHLLVQEELAGGDLRYIMLDAIRDFARDQLDAAGDRSAWRHQHALFYMSQAETADRTLRSADAAAWLTRLENAHHNLRAALEWLIGAAAWEPALRMGGALSRFWMMRGHYTEGRRWLRLILERADTQGAPDSGQPAARAMNGLASLALMQSDFEAASPWYERALAIHRRLGNAAETAGVLNNLGVVAASQGRYEQAEEYYRECLALRQTNQDAADISSILNNLGVIAQEQGRYDEALDFYQQSLALATGLADLDGEAIAHINLGELALIRHEYATARRVLDIAME
ncbi:MAG TPA: tetratricopeptide repeat protein, partial [Herpetosiphonaceae bacterium]